VLGGDGDDLINGESGDDSLSGGNGNDYIFDAVGADTLYGGAGDDFLSATQDNNPRQPLDMAGDSLFGDDGQDTLHGDYGDTLTGGDGLDTFLISHLLGTAAVTITDYNPDEGLHVTTYSTDSGTPEFGLRDAADGSGAELVLNGEVVANLSGLPAASLSTGEITLRYADNLDAVYSATHLGEPTPAEGTNGNDVFRGTSDSDTFDGGEGNDLIFGRNYADTLTGGAGQDLIDGGNGNDVLFGGADYDWLAGGNGDDSLDGGAATDILTGGAGDDTLLGGGGDDVLLGSTGADQLFGGAGDDFLDGVTPTNGQSLADAFNVDERGELTQAIQTNFGIAATTDDIDRFMRDLSSQEGVDAPDALYGGTGEDILVGNDGDTLSGGADEDIFIVPWSQGHDPVSITDYNTAGESVYVHISGDIEARYDFGVRDASDGTGVEVVLDGDIVAMLSGVSLASFSANQIQLEVEQDGYFISQSATVLAA
jgi:Ca2+-binding RTX toxin-like protein